MIGNGRLIWLTLAALLLTASLAAAQTPVMHSQVFRPPFITLAEKQLLEKGALQAKPLDLARYARLLRPPKLDHSDAITYIRCQDWGGGCMVYAGLYCADIINEWQAPYTPDLSWQYALRTWDEMYNESLRANPNADPPHLNALFTAGIASEGLCRSDSDYLTLAPANHPAILAKKDRLYWDPAPSAAAKAEAALYKFTFSDQITPSVDTLKTLLLTYGPVWAAGPWWWDGSHAMAFVGYDDVKREFKGVDSAGDWRHTKGFWTIPYDKLTEYVWYLQTMQRLPTNRWQGRWAYSSRIRITGAWRGAFSVNIGVQGQVPETVYRSYGRMAKRPYAFGERLELDVALPAYAGQFWPPRAAAKWYLQVEDNDRDSKQGRIVEWIIARRYQDPRCQSVDNWKTEEYRYSKAVTVPDATGDPLASPAPSPNNAPPAQRNSKPGLVTINLPETASTSPRLPLMVLQTKIEFEPEKITVAPSGATVLPGKLSTVAGQPVAGKTIELCKLTPTGNVHQPDVWVKMTTTTTDAQGKFFFKQRLPLVQTGRQVLGAVYRDARGQALCSTSPLVQEKSQPLWKPLATPILRVAPEMDLPRPVLKDRVR